MRTKAALRSTDAAGASSSRPPRQRQQQDTDDRPSARAGRNLWNLSVGHMDAAWDAGINRVPPVHEATVNQIYRLFKTSQHEQALELYLQV
jgi:hypothetical protein